MRANTESVYVKLALDNVTREVIIEKGKGILFKGMKPHIIYAQNYWKSSLRPGDVVIDATVGSGQDTVFLASLLKGKGALIGYDIQQRAINETLKRLTSLAEEERKIVQLKCRSHAQFEEEGAHLIIYNLGYLPGGDKGITTRVESTLESIKKALTLSLFISITCYPGHEEGKREQEAIIELVTSLPSHTWQVCLHQWLNRPLAPTLLWLRREPGA